MEPLMLTGTLIILGVICYQDFSTRTISLWIIVALLFLQLVAVMFDLPVNLFLEHVLINVSILVLLFTVVLVYYFFKIGSWVNIFDNYIGTGDILLLLVLCPGFAPLNFLVFILGCFILILIVTIIGTILRTSKPKTIPLAGYLALFYGLFLFIGSFIPALTPNNDSMLYVLLTGSL